MDLLEKCRLCPRKCGVNRHNLCGVCGADDKIKIAYYSLHEWEEPVISGEYGSGTIFFSNCNLKCIFCQNKKISTGGYGKNITNKQLLDIMLALQNKRAHNINLVTPTMYIPMIKDVLATAKENGLYVPIVYNTSSYENVDSLKILDGLIDIFLADLKYYDNNLGEKYSNCKNYFEVATLAIDEMYRQTGKFVIENNLMKKGLIVRVLVLPGHCYDAKRIIEYLHNKYKDNIIISIMNQYTPMDDIYNYPNLNRKLTEEEYNEVVNFACDLGIKNAFIQDGDTQLKSFIPDFDCNVF